MVDYNGCNDDVSLRVQQTLRDATDMTYGADNAAARLQTDVWNNYQQLGGGQNYKAYLDQVTATLAHSNVLPEVAACWVNHNTGRFDQTGDGKLDQGEINTAIGRAADPLEREMLMSVRDQYQTIRNAGGDNGGALAHDDFNQYEGQIQAQRAQAGALALQQQHSRYLMQPMLATDDGNPDKSLFRVLDNITGGAKDGDVSKKDLKSFVEQYDRAAMNGGDVNQGVWTRANRDYAQHLAQNWDTPEVKTLRTALEYDDDGNLKMETGSYITERSLLTASGYGAGHNVYQAFETPRPQPVQPVREVPQTAQPMDPYTDMPQAAPQEVRHPAARPATCGPTPEQIAQAKADFQRQLQVHINAEAHYTVKPGQGFDRIARDVIKTHSSDDSYRDPRKVIAYSDHIAKMNGRTSRLDKTPCLQPGEDLKVFDDAWVNAQIKARMAVFEQSLPKRRSAPSTVPSDDPGY